MTSGEKGAVHAIYQEASKPAGAKAAKRNRDSDIQQLNASPADVGVTRIHRASTVNRNSAIQQDSTVHRDSAIQQMAYTEEESEPKTNAVQTAGWRPHHQPDPCDVPLIQSCPPEPRWAAAGPNPMASGMMACDTCNGPSTENYPDEYLCDGGDRDLPVHYDQFNRRSLDTEDTILEYTDRTGIEKTKPSNRVCIYAPRFASVRTVSRPHEEFGSNEIAGFDHLAATSGMHSRLKASNNVKRVMTGGIAVRSRASGLAIEEGQGLVAQLRAPSAHDKLLNVYQSLNFVRFGRVDDSDTARLNYGLQAATLWTRKEFPVITAKTDMVLEGHFTQVAADITGIDDEDKAAEDLRIVKLADKKSASPGDEIEFTIRYDNLGGHEAYHIRIVDNLTPRLQYIVDSATSDRPGRLVLQDNGEGSEILVWELDDPLPGKTGGTVTFKARVR